MRIDRRPRRALPVDPHVAPHAPAAPDLNPSTDTEVYEAVTTPDDEALREEDDEQDEQDSDENNENNDDDDGVAKSHRRRTSSAFNRSNGLVLSATYLTVTYGGAPAYYSLWLGEKCSSSVVVHLHFMSESSAPATSAMLKLSSDRIVFTPDNYAQPQIVRVDLADQYETTNMILHRVFSLDKNYDRINTPNVVVKTEKSQVGSLLSLGGVLVHKRKNAKGEIMEPRHSANRSIDFHRALATAAISGFVAAGPAAVALGADSDSDSLSSSSSSSSLSSSSHLLSTAALHHVPTQPHDSMQVFVSHMAAGESFSAVVVKPQTSGSSHGGGGETLLVWGMNANGELGIGSTTPMVDPVAVAFRPPPRPLSVSLVEPFSVVSVACGKHHAALVTSQGRLFTWGNNRHGQLGLGDYTNVDTPQEVIVAAGALLFCQSASHQRALRIKHHAIHDQYALTASATNVTQVACGAFHTLFVTHQQHILSMGYNQAGQLGIGHRLQQLKGWRSCTPVLIETLRDRCILDVAAGQNHSACVLSNGAVFVWGCGGDGRLGVPLGGGGAHSSDCEVRPVQVLSLTDVGVKARTVRCGARHTAILSDRDLLYVWGANEFGQLGLGDKRTRNRPCLVQFAPFLREGVVDVALGEFHSACVTFAGNAFVWGLDLSGEESTRLDQRCSPEIVPLPPNERALKVACGWAHTTLLTQAAREDGDRETRGGGGGGATHNTKKKSVVPFHRRKERAHQFAKRQQEVNKWRRVTTALSVMGRLQHRVGGWRKKEKKEKKTPQKKLGFLDVVVGAFTHSRRNLLPSEEEQEEQEEEEGEEEEEEELKRTREEQIHSVARQLVADAVNQATTSAMAGAPHPKRPASGGATRPKRPHKQRPQSTPGRPAQPRQRPRPSTSVLHGVFYHNALTEMAPPQLPPPLSLNLPPSSSTSASCMSPRHFILSTPRATTECCLSPTPTPPGSRSRGCCSSSPSTTPSPSRGRTLKIPASALTSSCASLLSALRDEDESDHHGAADEELRSPTTPRSRSTTQAQRRVTVVESLLHKPTFSLTSHLVAQRPTPPPRTRTHSATSSSFR